MKKIVLEICAGSIEDVYAIKDLPIDRIELNSAIELGGLTPSVALFKKAKEITSKPIVCMIRPRGGGFCYNDLECEVMYQDAEMLLNHGADGIVIGILKKDGTIDMERMLPFIKLAKEKGKEIVFHRAFDYVRNDEEAIETLINHGVNRILLMAKPGVSIKDAARRIRVLQEKYHNKITLLAGGGLNEENLLSFIKESGVTSVHGTFKKSIIDESTGESSYYVSTQRVKDVLKLLQNKK